jgi:hypothetical protein
MIVYTGEEVYPKNNGVPSLESIGVALGRIPRFAGHCKLWYPVLCHTMVVADLVAKRYRIHALLHDAPEACVADVPTPWKTAAARKREKMLLKRIYNFYNIPAMSQADEEAVAIADALALGAEAHVLGHPAADEVWPNPSPRAIALTEFYLPHRLTGIEDPEWAAGLFTDAVNTMLARPTVKR